MAIIDFILLVLSVIASIYEVSASSEKSLQRYGVHGSLLILFLVLGVLSCCNKL